MAKTVKVLKHAGYLQVDGHKHTIYKEEERATPVIVLVPSLLIQRAKQVTVTIELGDARDL